jgi:hypothetical protein
MLGVVAPTRSSTVAHSKGWVRQMFTMATHLSY